MKYYVRSLSRVVGTLLLLLATTVTNSALGQSGRQPQPGDPDQTDDDLIRIRTEEVLVPVTVRDQLGQPVNGLKPESFFVYDNGVRQEIVSFNRRRIPINVVLLLDASGSVFEMMRFVREAAKGFLQKLLPEDRVCVMQFADNVELLQDWTNGSDQKGVEKALDWRYHAGQRTTFYDGLYLAANDQLRKVQGRRVIILLTDGIDTAERTRATFNDALNAVRREESSVYVVSLTASLRRELEKRKGNTVARMIGGFDPKQYAKYISILDQAEDGLTKLATRTGGRVFFPYSGEDLEPAYASIAEELRTQYILTYKPKPRAAGGEYRQIRVLVSPGGFEVAARDGYIGRS